MQPYETEMRRQQMVAAHENKEVSVRHLARRFAVAPNTVQSYFNPAEETDSVERRPRDEEAPPLLGDPGLRARRVGDWLAAARADERRVAHAELQPQEKVERNYHHRSPGGAQSALPEYRAGDRADA